MASDIKSAFKRAFRDYVTDGVPSSGENDTVKAEARDLGHVVQEAIEGAEAGLVRGELWVTLNAILGTRNGQPGQVPDTDLGTHVDPVSGLTVPNQGEYRWSPAPLGWRRVGDYQNLASKADQADLNALTATVDSKAGANEMGLGFRKMAVVQLINVGGTGNAVTADIPDDVDTARWVFTAGALVSLRWPADNAIGNPTLTVTDDNATYVITLSGEAGRALAPGELMANGDYIISFVSNAGSAAIGRVLNVQSTAVQSEIDRVVASQEIGRPGDAPYAWSTAITGLPESRSPLSGPVTVAGANGRVLRVTGPNSIAPRARYRLDPTRKYLVRFAYSRPQNVADPAGASVQCAFSWLQANGAAHATTPITVGHSEAPTTSDGRRVFALVIASVVSTGVDVVWPIGAIYFTPFFQTFQSDSMTDVETIDFVDITDFGGYSPDVTDLTARVGSLESEDLPARMAAQEAATASPSISRYATRADAISATIPASTDIVEVSAYSASHPTGEIRYERVAGSTPGGFQNTVDNQWWAILDSSVEFEMFGAQGDGSADDQAAHDNALAFGRPVVTREGAAYLVTDPTNSLGIPILGEGKVVKAVPGGFTPRNSNRDVLPVKFRSHLHVVKNVWIGNGNAKIVLFGDSTLTDAYGVNVGDLVAGTLRQQGLGVKQVINESIAGHSWATRNLATILNGYAEQKHLAIIKLGINNAGSPPTSLKTAREQLRNSMRQRLDEIRTSTYGDADDLSLALWLPHAIGNTLTNTTNKNNLWVEMILGAYVDAALEYQCAIFDPYPESRNAEGGINRWLDAEGVHLQVGANIDVIGRALKETCEPFGSIKRNGFVLKTADEGNAPTVASGLSAYDRGLSVLRAEAGDGWPFSGIVTTMFHPDGTGWQILDSYQLDYARARKRHWVTGSNAWSAWSGALNNLTLGTNMAVTGSVELPQYSKNLDGDVCIVGTIAASAAIAVNAVIATLPVGFRPSRDTIRWGVDYSTNANVRMRIKTNGEIITETAIANAALTTFANFIFRAA